MVFKRSRILTVLLSCILSSFCARAQTASTVTGTVMDAGGNPATSGTVEFDLQPVSSSVHYYVPGVGTIVPSVICNIVTGGQLQNQTGGACTVWSNALISPSNTTYTVTFSPNGQQTSSIAQECIQGATYSINNPVFCPVVSIVPQYNTITSSPISSNIVPSANHVFTLGNAQAYYAAAFVDNFNATQMTASSLSVPGRATFTSAANKGPRVDFTHPDFGIASGCSGPALVTNSSNQCQLQAAVNYIMAQGVGGYYPALYIPTGTWNVNGTVTIPPCVSVIGDGKESSILKETNATADLIRSAPITGFTCTAFVTGSEYRNLQLQGSNSATTGALIAFLAGPPPAMNSVTLAYTAGRGIVSYETTERTNFTDVTENNVVFNSIIDSYEHRFINLTESSPGITGDGKCYTVNCNVNNTFPAPMPSSSYSIISASGNGTTASYVFSGNSGVAPLAAGNYFGVSGITVTTALNGDYQIIGTANNTPTSGQFTYTVSSAANGTGTVTSATFGTALLPENRHAANWVGGGYWNMFLGGEMKPLQALPAFKFANANADLLSDLYTEGYLNSINSEVLFSGLPDQLVGNGTTTTCTISSNNYRCIPVTSVSEMWWPAYLGQSADIPTYGSTATYNIVAYIFCPDYVAGGTNPCAANSGVQQGQYEIASVLVANDTGKAYIISGNQSGSTAPANTLWVNPIIDLQEGGATGDGLTIQRIHAIADNPSSLQAGYVPYCVDGNQLQCAEIQTAMDDGYVHHNGGWGSAAGLTYTGNLAQINLNMPYGTGFPETTGEQWIKNSARLALAEWPNLSPVAIGETAADITGGNLEQQNGGYPSIISTSANAITPVNNWAQQYHNAAAGGQAAYSSVYDAFNPTNLGNNPNWSWGKGRQFYNSDCSVGTPTSGGSSFRFCLLDNNNSGGPEIVVQTTTNSGSTWTTTGTVSASGPTGWFLPSASTVIHGSLPFQPSPYTSLTTGTVLLGGQFQGSGTFKTLVTTVSGTFTCGTNPTIELLDCGSSISCSSPTTLGSKTLTGTGSVATSMGSTSFALDDYFAWEFASGSACTALTVNATAAY